MPAVSSCASLVRRLLRSLIACLVFVPTVNAVSAIHTTQQIQDPPDERSDVQAQKLFIRGMTETYLEDYGEAVSFFERALEHAPNEAAILSALADAEAGRENVTSAIYYARQAREQDSGAPYYAHHLADLLRQADRLREAEDIYRTLLSIVPNDIDAQYELAGVQRQLGKPEQALDTYRGLLDSANGPQPKAHTEMLELYRTLGSEAGVEQTLKTLIELRQTPTPYRKRLGQLYVEQNRYREAIPIFEALVEEHPDAPHLLSQLKTLYAQTGQPRKVETLGSDARPSDRSPEHLVGRARALYEKRTGPSDTTAVQAAIDVLQKVLETAPNTVEALDLLGTIRLNQQQYATAASLFERAIEVNPRTADRWRQAAISHLNADSLEKARAIAEEGRLLFPGEYDLSRVEGLAHLRMGKPEPAKSRFREALSLIDSSAVSDSTRAALYVGLARAQQNLGRFETSDSTYRAALRLVPDNTAALHQYAYSLAERSQALDQALDLAQRAADLDGSNPAVLGTLGWVYFKRENYSAAQSAFEAALSTDGAGARVYEHYGDLHRALGNLSTARDYWAEALERAPHRDSLRQKLKSAPQS